MRPCPRSGSLSNEPCNVMSAHSQDARLRGRGDPSDGSQSRQLKTGTQRPDLPQVPVFPERLSWFTECGRSSRAEVGVTTSGMQVLPGHPAAASMLRPGPAGNGEAADAPHKVRPCRAHPP